jgi:hypothetical protein
MKAIMWGVPKPQNSDLGEFQHFSDGRKRERERERGRRVSCNTQTEF